MKKIVLLIFPLSFAASMLAQVEVERDLPFNYVQASAKAAERNFAPRHDREGGSFSLPFFDDFSRYSLPTSNPDIPASWQRWEDDDVFINDAFAISPPSIGVATFDGLGPDGCPYDFSDPNSYGGADTLTSLPLNLSGLDESSNVQLMFYYEPGGIGNFPEDVDSLVLEFYSPFGAGQWIHRWSVPGNDVAAFEKVLIPIVEPEYLLDGFRFRFRNYATLSASADFWHLDYVAVDQNFNYVDCEYDDVAMQHEIRGLLDEYTAMPWTHFIDDPASFMTNSIDITQQNLGPTANIVTGFSVQYEDQHWDFPNIDFNTFGNGCSEYTRTIDLGGFDFDSSVNDTCAVFDVKAYCTTTDGTPQNDTARFQQVFTNYYAYDDGTAERAYAINTTGGKVAVKYFAEVPDSLLGLFMYWIPFVEDQSDKNFLLRAWSDGGGIPGNELSENFTFYHPNYYCNGYNVFGYYAYDNPIFVSGNFYVGWIQDNNAELNIGNDKNGTTNQTQLFYQNGGTSTWNQSLISGAVMIRPVFKSGKSSVWNSISENGTTSFTLFPNPAENELNIMAPVDFGSYHVKLLDLSGKTVLEMTSSLAAHRLDVSNLSDGLYIVQLVNQLGEKRQQKFVKK